MNNIPVINCKVIGLESELNTISTAPAIVMNVAIMVNCRFNNNTIPINKKYSK